MADDLPLGDTWDRPSAVLGLLLSGEKRVSSLGVQLVPGTARRIVPVGIFSSLDCRPILRLRLDFVGSFLSSRGWFEVPCVVVSSVGKGIASICNTGVSVPRRLPAKSMSVLYDFQMIAEARSAYLNILIERRNLAFDFVRRRGGA